MRFNHPAASCALAAVLLLACSPSPTATGPSTTATDENSLAFTWGPEAPNFNLQVILRPVGDDGFGLVKFRQPNDVLTVVRLDTWVRDLAPSASYYLERAVDVVVDDACTSTDWLRLGEGPTVVPVVTDDAGTGRAELWRSVPPLPGMEFDIHFRIVDANGTAVLQSECYQFTISL
jgi:hypothetical protein